MHFICVDIRFSLGALKVTSNTSDSTRVKNGLEGNHDKVLCSFYFKSVSKFLFIKIQRKLRGEEREEKFIKIEREAERERGWGRERLRNREGD